MVELSLVANDYFFFMKVLLLEPRELLGCAEILVYLSLFSYLDKLGLPDFFMVSFVDKSWIPFGLTELPVVEFKALTLPRSYFLGVLTKALESLASVTMPFFFSVRDSSVYLSLFFGDVTFEGETSLFFLLDGVLFLSLLT